MKTQREDTITRAVEGQKVNMDLALLATIIMTVVAIITSGKNPERISLDNKNALPTDGVISLVPTEDLNTNLDSNVVQ